SDSQDNKDGYFGPVTRSATRRRLTSSYPIYEVDADSSLDRRARTKSRGSVASLRPSGLNASKLGSVATGQNLLPAAPNGKVANGHLSPISAAPSFWSDISRSPSPLGLIPIHRHFRSLVRRSSLLFQ